MTDATPAAQSRLSADALVRRFSLLSPLRRDDLRSLVEAARRVARPSGAVVFARGDSALRVYLVLGGEVALRAIPRGQTEAIELRRVQAGEAFGLEAAFGAAVHHASADVVTPADLLEVPAELFARALRRSAGADVAKARAVDELERAVRRRLTDEHLRTMALSADLPRSERKLLLDMVRRRKVAAGGRIYRTGQRAEELFLIARGLVRLGTARGTEVHVRAYLTDGDFFGEHETLAGTARTLTAEAVTECELLVVGREHLRTLTARSPGLLESLQRISYGRLREQQDVFADAAEGDLAAIDRTRHLFEDVHRAAAATELLAIDLGQCINCGTCAWSCHQTHGHARLVRRGEKVRGPGASLDLEDGRHLLLPNSCQHCTDPACMVDCPTGAIGRDPSGEVFINAATCIGCEACAKACPWDNIQIAPSPPGSPYEQVALKCDLCRGYAESACVSNCPTGAISRLDPKRESRALRDVLGLDLDAESAPRTPPTRASGRDVALIFGVGVLGALAGVWANVSPYAGLGLAAGIAGALGLFALAGYGARKRRIRRWMVRHRTKRGVPLSTWYLAHLVIGAGVLAAVGAHTGGDPGGPLTSALLAAIAVSTLLGGCGALAYATLPRRIARLVERPHLSEDFAAEKTRLEHSLRDILSGRDEAKARAAHTLVPALGSALLPARVLLRGLDRHALRKAMLASALAGDAVDDATRHALDRAAREVTAHVALRAERLAQRTLAGWLAPHIAASGLALVLLIAHVAAAIALLWGT